MRNRLEVQGLLEEQEAPGIPETLAGAVARLRGGGLLAELIDPPELNEPDPTLIMGPQRQRNFERFFQDSVVRDEDGEPVIVYHGTQKDFDRFDDSKIGEFTRAPNTMLGHFFTDEPTIADHFSGANLFNRVHNRTRAGGNTKPMNIRINNPYILESRGGEGLSLNDRKASNRYTDSYDLLSEMIDQENIGVLNPSKDMRQEYKQLRQRLMDQGHDGIILKDSYMDTEFKPGTHYIIFDPKQAKSIFNDGTYDLDDDNFMSQLRRMKGLLEG